MRSGLHLIGKRTTVFDGFELERIDVGEAELRVRHGGSGSPLLLLHGHQRTHATWHRVAPLLARDHSVVCPDLRGYGASSKPATTPDHEPYSKRAMARDCVALMRALGHDRSRSPATIAAAMSRFASRSTVRTLRHLVVMDGVPIGEALARADAHFAAAWWHWFFLGQTAKPAERVICADPDAWYDIDPVQMGEEAYAELRHALHDPETVHAMCEDYRAGLGIDRDHDAADRREGRRASCPALVIWAKRDDMEDLYGDPVSVWREWLADIRDGVAINSGHHIAEEAPNELADAIRVFLATA
jgi:haloacetate dehalogenase